MTTTPTPTPSYEQIVDALIERPERSRFTIILNTDDLTPFLQALSEKYGTKVAHDSFTVSHYRKDEWEISFEVFLNNDR